VLVILATAYLKAGSARTLVQFPWSFVTVGAATLAVRMLFLLVMTGTIWRVAAAVVSVAPALANGLGKAISDEDDYVKWEPAVIAKARARARNRIKDHKLLWFGSLVVGVLALMTAVAGSGGMADSPFRDLLVATFILGQFRSPSDNAIWALFYLGIAAATGAHVEYIGLHHLNPSAYDAIDFYGVSYIAPGVLVAFMSTLVYWITFRRGGR
jgi:hypothetical protein